MRGIDDEVLEVHGWAPERKAEGTTRFIYKTAMDFLIALWVILS